MPTPAEATSLAAERIETVIAAGAGAQIALAGGETPRATYERLAESVENWNGAELWLGDERMVAPGDAEANLRMVRETLVERVAAEPPPRLHAVHTELNAEQAADDYGQRLVERTGEPVVLSLALLGLGEDAHTASLFPCHPALEQSGICVAVHDAPKPPPDRVTLTLPVLNASRRLIVLAVGEGKKHAVAATLGDPDPRAPASLLARGGLELITDEAAAAAVPAARNP